MERLNIPMLNRFDTISHIMAYYSFTHKAFLLLTSLWSVTRNKLDEFYDEFALWMKDNSMKIKVNSLTMHKYFFLPNDLFILDIGNLSEAKFEVFIKFIKDLEELKGWYFNNHYLHSKIKILDPIVVDVWLIKKLSHNLDLLNSIKVYLWNKSYKLVSLFSIFSMNIHNIKLIELFLILDNSSL